MRIHTNDTGTGLDSFVDTLHAARAYASQSVEGVVFLDYQRHGSRSHALAFEIKLTGDGSKNKRRTNPGASRNRDTDYAASWSQWGHFLGYLYEIDPTMKAGPYKSAEDFHHQTFGQFRYSPCGGSDVILPSWKTARLNRQGF